RLFNPVFARMWKLDPAALAERPHIEGVIGWCQALSGDDPIWPALRATVTAIDDRGTVTGRIHRRDGNVVDCATVPLPDGATLVTFQRSEEHTSELQSLAYLVCRLLLEKKKINNNTVQDTRH